MSYTIPRSATEHLASIYEASIYEQIYAYKGETFILTAVRAEQLEIHLENHAFF